MNYAELRKINVNDHVEKKGNLTYLSWAWAVDQLLQRDPAASWDYRWFGEVPYCVIGSTAMVFCTVKAFGVDRTAQLPIMDNRNNPIPVDKVNSFSLNTAMQRALAKAIALHGIGIYIYAGEDLPDGEDAKEPKATSRGMEQPQRLDISPERLNELVAIAEACEAAYQAEDEWGAYGEISVVTDPDEKVFVWGRLKHNSRLRSALKRMGEEERAKQAELDKAKEEVAA